MTTLDTRPIVGPILDTYGSWETAVRQIGDTVPHGIKVQGWPDRQSNVIADARRRWPTALVALCPGVDPVASRWRSREHDPKRGEKAIVELVGIADGAASLGIGHVCFDPEAAWKGATIAERNDLDTIAREALARIRIKHPTMQLSVTTYGWIARARGIGGHSMWASRGWLSGGAWYVSQNYDRGPGQLVNGEIAGLESFASLKASLACDAQTERFCEVQTHHNTVAELVTVGTSTPATFWWAAGKEELFDAKGGTAWRAATALYRAGYWGDGCVAKFQRDRGLVADGKVGPLTLAALNVR